MPEEYEEALKQEIEGVRKEIARMKVLYEEEVKLKDDLKKQIREILKSEGTIKPVKSKSGSIKGRKTKKMSSADDISDAQKGSKTAPPPSVPARADLSSGGDEATAEKKEKKSDVKSPTKPSELLVERKEKKADTMPKSPAKVPDKLDKPSEQIMPKSASSKLGDIKPASDKSLPDKNQEKSGSKDKDTVLFSVKALDNHKEKDPRLLAFKKGDVIQVLAEDAKTGEYLGILGKKRGYFPTFFAMKM